MSTRKQATLDKASKSDFVTVIKITILDTARMFRFRLMRAVPMLTRAMRSWPLGYRMGSSSCHKCRELPRSAAGAPRYFLNETDKGAIPREKG